MDSRKGGTPTVRRPDGGTISGGLNYENNTPVLFQPIRWELHKIKKRTEFQPGGYSQPGSDGQRLTKTRGRRSEVDLKTASRMRPKITSTTRGVEQGSWSQARTTNDPRAPPTELRQPAILLLLAATSQQ